MNVDVALVTGTGIWQYAFSMYTQPSIVDSSGVYFRYLY